jgi:putative endonuclease
LLRRCASRNDSGQQAGAGVEKVYCVYILTNQRDTVLYTGVTGDLRARVQQHREKLLPGFTNRYNVSKLVYYEAGDDASGVIAREKQIKAGSRQKKIDLINRLNPEWRDLYDDLKRDRFVAPLLA